MRLVDGINHRLGLNKKGGTRDAFLDPDGFRRKLNNSLTKLNLHIQRLDTKFKELEVKAKEYFDRCVEEVSKGDKDHAAIYASEIAELRKLANIILHTLLVLEQIKIRLETLLELSEVVGLISSLKGMINTIMSEVSRVAPEVAAQLEELSNNIDEVVMLSNPPDLKVESKTQELSDDAMKVIEDAKRIAAMKLSESFPDVPLMTDAEQLVYSYISTMGPEFEFDIDVCAKDLGLSKEVIEKALFGLQRKGIIDVAEWETA